MRDRNPHSRIRSRADQVVHATLEVGDELFALSHEPTLRNCARVEAALHRLHERDVLLRDLVVPHHELVDLLGRGVGPEVVVRHFHRSPEAVGQVPLHRDIRNPGGDVHRRRREQVVVLRLRDVAARLVQRLAVARERGRADGADLAREGGVHLQRYESGLTSITLLNPGCAVGQW